MQLNADNMGVDDGFDMLDYSYASPPRRSNDPVIHAERNLWCAVVAQAFIDIGAIVPMYSGGKPVSPRTQGKEYDEALRWLIRDNSDFAYICDLAGLSPHIIRCAARIFHGRRQLSLSASGMTIA